MENIIAIAVTPVKKTHKSFIQIFTMGILLLSNRHAVAQCFPVPFDHFWFRVDSQTYKKMGQSSYFRDEQFSFFEANKSPVGTYFGHYLTGNLHNLEIFEESMPNREEPIGIGFLSEKTGCLKEIHARLNKKIKKQFSMMPDADWGGFTQLERNPSIAIWVSELKAAYVGSPDASIDRSAWMKRIRQMNNDPYQGAYNFHKIKKVIWRLNSNDADLLKDVFDALGWQSIGKDTFSYDGSTVIIKTSKNIPATRALKSLSLELIRPYKSVMIGKFLSTATENPAEVTFKLK